MLLDGPKKILKGYDPILYNALYKDTKNFYITVTLYLLCQLTQQYSYKENIEFYELLIDIAFCSKLNYPADFSKRCINEFLKIIQEEKAANAEKIVHFDTLFIKMGDFVKSETPDFILYKYEDYMQYRGVSIVRTWSTIIGPLLWTWAHLTFANTKDIKKRQKYTALIITFDYLLGCIYCKNHYLALKPVVFSVLSTELEQYDAETIFIDTHTFVQISIAQSKLGPKEHLLLWRDVRLEIREKFIHEYRMLSSQMIKE